MIKSARAVIAQANNDIAVPETILAIVLYAILLKAIIRRIRDSIKIIILNSNFRISSSL